MHKLIPLISSLTTINAIAITPALQTLNLPSLSNSTTPLTAPEIFSACDASIYGKPGTTSCLDVYRQLSDDTKVVEFGDRSRGSFQYPLPYRLSSGDGKCVIEIENLPWAYKDFARMVSIRAAAVALMGKCVYGQRAGGVTTGLGKEGNLALTIQTYDPNVQCQKTMSRSVDPNDCKALLQAMPASTDEQVFGPKGGQGVEVELPYNLVAPGKECGFYFNSHGGPQTSKWYDLWQAATALSAICGRKFEQGSAVVGGNAQGIDVAMHRPPDGALGLNGTVDGAASNSE